MRDSCRRAGMKTPVCTLGRPVQAGAVPVEGASSSWSMRACQSESGMGLPGFVIRGRERIGGGCRSSLRRPRPGPAPRQRPAPHHSFAPRGGTTDVNVKDGLKGINSELDKRRLIGGRNRRSRIAPIYRCRYRRNTADAYCALLVYPSRRSSRLAAHRVPGDGPMPPPPGVLREMRSGLSSARRSGGSSTSRAVDAHLAAGAGPPPCMPAPENGSARP